jgi:hypothetical protein
MGLRSALRGNIGSDLYLGFTKVAVIQDFDLDN